MIARDVPPVLGRPDLQPLMTRTLDLVELLDVARPNLDRQLAIDLLLACPSVTAGQVTELASLVLADVPVSGCLPQVSALAGTVRDLLLRPLVELHATPRPHHVA